MNDSTTADKDRSIVLVPEVMSEVSRRAYTPEEVAGLLGLHVNSVYSMLNRGDLPGLKAGRKWLISKLRFDAWLNGGGGE